MRNEERSPSEALAKLGGTVGVRAAGLQSLKSA